ncbi:maltase A1-like [Pieris brassicae]|uniref:maltase A1-like n=1 Tax=Pieris brassicae TaxID=7116 RepID=UPI001E65E4C4|nr:maltase A1-like [Pieris brassicae]XP_045524288.1 maltase A1-like [Pieris brassicae]
MRLLLILIIAEVSAVDLEWWKSALIYQIYPKSFKDSNGDGTGDLNGITEKLPYLQETGIDAIWLSPIFLSPMYDAGYDISDYRQIAPEFGTMEDFETLLAKAKGLGLRVLLDLVPNHTSNESEWFIRSKKGDPEFSDYYVWADGINTCTVGETQPPSNWLSHFRKSAWEYSVERGQFYLHQFVIGQPDLNYRNKKVQEEMKDVLRFWLDRGISGYRIDAVNMIYEADPKNFCGRYPDEPRSGDPNAVEDDYNYLKHIYTKDQDETYSVIYDWREVLDEYTIKDQEYKIMITEAYTDLEHLMRYYGDGKRNGSIPFNFSLLENIRKDSDAVAIKRIIDQWMENMPVGRTANWVNGNHDQSRLATRVGVDRVDAMNMLTLLLPGVAFTYQGEELGMTDGFITWEETQDPQACNTDDPINYWKNSRDPSRTPYHWDDSPNAGFSTTDGKTWLPVADNYKDVNLDAQLKANKSHYQFYKDVVTIRKKDAVRKGALDIRSLSNSTLVVARMLPDNPAIVGVINLSDDTENTDLSEFEWLPTYLIVVASGVDCEGSALENGAIIRKEKVIMTGKCALLLQSLCVTTKDCCENNK